MDLPARRGPPPETHFGMPHQQQTQNADEDIYEALAERMFSLPQTVEQPSQISVPGARALVLAEDVEPGPPEAFMVGREFCHLHPPYDASLHMCLPVAVAKDAIDAGWAELHPLAAAGRVPPTRVMVFGPRDEEELEIVFDLIQASHRFATGSV